MDPNGKKKGLVDKLNKQSALERIKKEKFKRITVSFYRYCLLDNINLLRDDLFTEWSELNVLGRVYIANEGINAQVSIPENKWNIFKKSIEKQEEFKQMPFKIAIEDKAKSFLKLTIKVKQKIVADGLLENEYDVTNVGRHLNASQWNSAIDDGAIVVDVRNHYESEIGRFQNAICPQVETFKEELPEIRSILKGKEEKKILLYCTGGIRCEKTSAYLRHYGFKNVSQLYGGIIEYTQQLKKNPNLENKFRGKNFVFDERLSERITDDVISNCHQCSKPSDTHVNCKNVNCNLLFIQCDECNKKNKGCCSPNCIDITLLSYKDQVKLRKGSQVKKRFHSHKKIDLSKKFK